MNTAEVLKGDLIVGDELCSITGVSSKARDKIQKMKKVLDDAGIYCWFLLDKKALATTWYHIHNAGKLPANEPHFDTSVIR